VDHVIRIPDVKQEQKRGDEKKISCPSFLLATKITNLIIILILNWRRKNLGQFTKNYNFLPKKWSLNSQKYGLGIPDPGVKKAPDPGSGSATLCITKSFSVIVAKIHQQ
jgi:hypothetical protein